VPGTLRCITQLPQESKRAALLGVILGQRAHGHESLHLDAIQKPELIQKRGKGRRCHPTLLRLSRTVDLYQDRLAAPRGCPAIELGSEVGAIHRVNEDESPDGIFRLVALQRTNQVPLDGYIEQRLLLLQRLLNPILAYVPEPSGKGGTHGFGTVRLGDSHDSDAVAPPADLLVLSHRIAHCGQPAREAWEVHNPLIYLGMLGY
jgi:hypothetical protein